MKLKNILTTMGISVFLTIACFLSLNPGNILAASTDTVTSSETTASISTDILNDSSINVTRDVSGTFVSITPNPLMASLVTGNSIVKSISMTNTAPNAANWVLSKIPDVAWLQLDNQPGPQLGTLAPGASQVVAAAFSANGLATGVYTTTLNMTTDLGDNVDIPVTLTVSDSPPASVTITPNSITATLIIDDATSKGITLSNGSGSNSANWVLSETPDVTWLQLDSQSGSLVPGGNQSIIASINSNSMAAGVYTTTLNMSTSLGDDVNVPVTLTVAGNIRYAAPSSAGNGDCLSWSSACTLQTALSQAFNGIEIWVKMGVYYPGSVQTDTFYLQDGVSLYGGFLGSETELIQRNYTDNITVLSGDIDQNDITDADNVVVDTNNINGNNSYHVVRGNADSNVGINTPIFDGFTITAGKATDVTSNSGGGLLNNTGGSATLVNLIFSGNSATYGGGMFNSGNVTFANVIFNNNSASEEGGGISTVNSNPTWTDVTFSHNSASIGGGMYLYSTSGNPILSNAVFDSNIADGGIDSSGGGLHSSGNPILTNVIFRNNVSTAEHNSHGGGMVNSGDATLSNVIFIGNSALATNQIFTDFSASGGGMSSGGDLSLTNVVFYGNSVFGTFGAGGSGLTVGGNSVLTNVIMRDNYLLSAGSITISHSNIEGSYGPANEGGFDASGWNTYLGIDGGNNIDADPLFIDANGLDDIIGTPDDNLRLGAGSPSIDTGTNSGCSAADLDGTLRPLDGDSNGTAVCDMGVYEASACEQVVTVQNIASSGAGSLREAIGLSCSDGLITFNNALTGQTIDISPDGELYINKNLTIHSAVPLHISGGNSSRVFNIADVVVTINGLLIVDGNVASSPLIRNTSGETTYAGGGILNAGQLSLNNCTVGNNAANNGGGIYNSGTLNIKNCTLSQNSAVSGGGLYNRHNGNVIIDSGSVVFSGNTASVGEPDVTAEAGNVLFATDYVFLPVVIR